MVEVHFWDLGLRFGVGFIEKPYSSCNGWVQSFGIILLPHGPLRRMSKNLDQTIVWSPLAQFAKSKQSCWSRFSYFRFGPHMQSGPNYQGHTRTQYHIYKAISITIWNNIKNHEAQWKYPSRPRNQW
jgi:hypothetical protein